MLGRAGGLDVVLNEDTILKDSDARGVQQFSAGVEAGAVKDDVVGLPLAWRTRSIDQRGILAVNGAGLTIGVRLVLVGVEDLDFVGAHQEDATISAFLALSVRRIRLGKFNVKLAITEGIFGVNVPRFWHDLEVPLLDLPFCGTAVGAEPLFKARAVEQDDGVGGRFAGNLRGAGGAGSDDGGPPVDGLDRPLVPSPVSARSSPANDTRPSRFGLRHSA